MTIMRTPGLLSWPLWLVFLVLLRALILSYAESERIYENDANISIVASYQQFQDTVESSPSIWMIHMYNTSVTPKQAEIISALAELLKGIFRVGAIDMTVCQDVQTIQAKYSLSSSSSSLVLLADEKRHRAVKVISTTDMNLQKLTDSILQVAGQTIMERSRNLGMHTPPNNNKLDDDAINKIVMTVTDATFEKDVLQNPAVVMVAFTAPWCGHCKRLEPEWKQAANILIKNRQEHVVLAWVDATANPKLAAQYKVQGYPTIKLFPGNKVDKSIKDATDFNGERTAPAIAQAMLAEVDRTGIPPEIPELTSNTIMKEHCAGANHICILVGLPHILDSGADGRNKYKETVAKVAKAFRSSMAFSFLWFQGTAQPDLENALELTFGFPAVVAFSMDRKAYAVMRGSFTEKSMMTFLHSLTTGRQTTVPLQTLPKVADVEGWDGSDAAPVEEEFSLEDIMGENL